MRAFAFALSLFAAHFAVAQESGVLLSLANRDGQTSTAWLGTKGVASFAKRATAAGFLVWREDGLWRVAEDDKSRTGGVSTVRVTDPKGKVTVIQGEEGRPETSYHVIYVSAFGIGLLQTMKAAVEPDANTAGGFGGLGGKSYPSVYKNFAWSDLSMTAEVGVVFGESVAKLFDDGAEVTGRSAGGGKWDREASPTNWTLLREPGQWSLKGRVLPDAADTIGSGPLDFRVTKINDLRFGEAPERGPNWARVRGEYPDAIDFTTSPDGSLTVVVTEDVVYLHASNGTSLGRRLQLLRVESTRLVGAQWLDGDAVAKVATAIGKL